MDLYDSLRKRDLNELADRLKDQNDREAVDFCVGFIEAETKGIWHGRARAMMCRRLKHVMVSDPQRKRLVATILNRFSSGDFSEQFKDQLRLVLQIDPAATYKMARERQNDPLPHIRRYAAWIHSHQTP
jgi:hypothetical protein